MLIRCTALLLLVCCLAGCKAVDGRYEPGCMAYAGSTILLSDGTFSWDKFTDAVNLDENGNVIDAFPNYPKRGTYRIDEPKVVLTFESDGSVTTLHMNRNDDGRVALLTDEQQAAWATSGRLDECALTRAEPN